MTSRSGWTLWTFGGALGAALSLGAANDYTVAYGGGTTTVSVVMGKTVDSANVQDGDSVALATALTGTHKTDVLVKDGPGLLVMSQDLKAFAGEVIVKTGGLKATHQYALGADGTSAVPGSSIRVLDGATFYADASAYSKEAMRFQYRPFLFGGFGEDGSGGAFVGTAGSRLYCVFDYSAKTLLSDARMNGAGGRIDVRFGTFDMGFHTLYLTNNVGLTGMTVVNPGHIVADPGANLTFEANPNFGGGATNVFTLREGSRVSMRPSTTPIWWKLYVPGNAIMCEELNTTSGTNYNVWAGPVEIASGGVLTHGGRNITIAGKVSGAGSIETSSGTLNLISGNNDLSGEVLVNGGTLNVYGLGSVPNWDATHLKMSSGALNLYMNETDTNQTDRIAAFLAYNASSSLPICFVSDVTIPVANGYKAAKTPKAGSAALTLKGAGADDTHDLGVLSVTCGSLILKDLGFVDAGILRNYVGDVWPNVARLVFDSGTRYAATVQPTADSNVNKDKSYVYVGKFPDNRANVRGIVEIREGAVVSNRFELGRDGWDPSCGSLYQRGGRYVTHYTNWGGADCVGGGWSSGYEELDDGYRLVGGNNGQWHHIGYSGPCPGVVSILGGTYEQLTQGMTIAGVGGTGEVHVAGGTFKPGHFTIGGYVHRYNGEVGGYAVYNQTGGDVIGNSVFFGAMSNGTSIASFGGGTFCASRFYGVNNQNRLKGNKPVPYPLSVSKKYVNLNGTTFTRYQSNGRLFDDEFSRFTVFPRGVIFSSENESGVSGTQTFDYSLEAPEGKGIVSIAVPTQGSTPWNYIGAPFVWIIDPTGQGYGASAHADFDSVSGTITNITVVSPGCNYGAGTYAVLDSAGFTNRVTIAAKDVTLADNVSGGLVKIGAGTLQLKVANAYTGWTRVEKGTLDVTVAGSYPASSPLDLAGGNLLCAANTTLSVPQLKGNAGSVNANVTVTDALVVDCAAMTSGEQYVINGTLNLNGARIVVSNVPSDENFQLSNFVSATGGISGNYTVEGISDPWRLYNRGNTLTLRTRKGMCILFR